MNASTVVFLGPSLSRSRALEVLPDAEYLPPIRRGDINALIGRDTPPERIAIVDGCFLHAMSISPKEVIKAMNKGVRCYGSSSMGALRATELHRWGMVGVGDVFELYHSGEVDADDEVAITFDPDSLRALCTPMVNFRVAVRVLVARGLMTPAFGARFLEAAKALYFPDRTPRAVFHALAGEFDPDVVERHRLAYEEHAPDAKGDDAVRLLTRLRTESAAGSDDAATPAFAGSAV